MAARYLLLLGKYRNFSCKYPNPFFDCAIYQKRYIRHNTGNDSVIFKLRQRFKNILQSPGVRNVALLSVLGYLILSLVFKKENKVALLGNEKKSKRSMFGFIADIVDRVNESVVLIEVGNLGRNMPMMHQGSGFIVSNDGWIVTNAHVVGWACGKKVMVSLKNKHVYEGLVEAVDDYVDLALVKINCKNLPALPLGRNDLRAGEWVVAIGSPHHLSNSVTTGVVSSAERHASEIGLRHKNIKYIQTDAAISHGNSGGPLVNLDGEVVGVNTLGLTPGFSFAVPVEYVKALIKNRSEMRTKGHESPFAGLSALALTPQLINVLISNGVPIPGNINGGVLIFFVQQNSPAHRGGLQAGDIIYEANKQPVTSLRDLSSIVETQNSVTMKILRNGVVNILTLQKS